MIQCGAVNFYNIGTRGTRPFTISFIPQGGAPVSVQVPDSYTLNISNFNFLSYVPFVQGTQFQTVLGDASGPGSGGASGIYTVGPSTFSPNCLAEGYRLQGQFSAPLPIASTVATYSNLPGAIATSQPTSKSASTPTGAIAGGAIGGAIALGVAIGCLVAFLLYRKRQKTKRDLARNEEVRFVDLDGDDDDDWGAPDGSRSQGRDRRGHREDGRSSGQSYSVSPFVYEPRHQSGLSDQRFGQSLEMTSRPSTDPSYGELLSAAGISSVGVSPSDDYPPHAVDPSVQSHSSQTPLASHGAGVGHEQGMSNAGSQMSSSGAVLHMAARPPNKAQLAADQARRDQRAARQVLQHSDGGPLPQPSSDTEDEDIMDELPPEYGGWLQNSHNAGNSSGSSNNRR